MVGLCWLVLVLVNVRQELADEKEMGDV